MPCYDAEFHPEANMEPALNNTSAFLGKDQQIFPEPQRAHRNPGKECMGLITEIKKKMQQTEIHSRHLLQVEGTVNSLLLNITDTINAGTKTHQHDQKRKTLAQDHRRHLCVPSLSNRRRSMATHR